MLTHTLTTGANDGRPIHMFYKFSDGEHFTVRSIRRGWHQFDTQVIRQDAAGKVWRSTMAELDAKAATSTLTTRTETP
jgi:hypothetical protein